MPETTIGELESEARFDAAYAVLAELRTGLSESAYGSYPNRMRQEDYRVCAVQWR